MGVYISVLTDKNVSNHTDRGNDYARGDVPIKTVATSEAMTQNRGLVICLMRNLRMGSRDRSCRFERAMGSPSRCMSSVSKAKVVAAVVPYRDCNR